MTEKKIGVRIGALAPPLAEQMKEQGVVLVPGEQFMALQEDVDALNRLYVRGILPETPATQTRRKLMKTILAFVKTHGVIP